MASYQYVYHMEGVSKTYPGGKKLFEDIPYIVDVDDYYSLDMRLAWRPMAGLELALVGQNLLEEQHTESHAEFGTVSTAVPRGFYGQIKWQY